GAGDRRHRVRVDPADGATSVQPGGEDPAAARSRHSEVHHPRARRGADGSGDRGVQRGPGGREGRGSGVISRVEAILKRYREIEAEMVKPEVLADHEKLARLGREQRSLREVVETYEAYRRA